VRRSLTAVGHPRQVPCPTCGAPQGAACVTTRGKSVGARIHGTHPARKRIAEARANRLEANLARDGGSRVR